LHAFKYRNFSGTIAKNGKSVNGRLGSDALCTLRCKQLGYDVVTLRDFVAFHQHDASGQIRITLDRRRRNTGNFLITAIGVYQAWLQTIKIWIKWSKIKTKLMVASTQQPIVARVCTVYEY